MKRQLARSTSILMAPLFAAPGCIVGPGSNGKALLSKARAANSASDFDRKKKIRALPTTLKLPSALKDVQTYQLAETLSKRPYASKRAPAGTDVLISGSRLGRVGVFDERELRPIPHG